MNTVVNVRTREALHETTREATQRIDSSINSKSRLTSCELCLTEQRTDETGAGQRLASRRKRAQTGTIEGRALNATEVGWHSA
jgi:hypothetical protein